MGYIHALDPAIWEELARARAEAAAAEEARIAAEEELRLIRESKRAIEEEIRAVRKAADEEIRAIEEEIRAIEEHDRIVTDLLDCYIENRIDKSTMKRAYKDPVYAAQLHQELLGGQAPEQTTGLS